MSLTWHMPDLPRARVVGVRVFGADGERSWLYEAVVPLVGGVIERRLCRSWTDAMACARGLLQPTLVNRRGHWTRPAPDFAILHSGDVATWARHVYLTSTGNEQA